LKLHLIPGVAADRRIFEKLELPGHEMKVLELPEMTAGSSIRDYVEKLAAGVVKEKPHVLIGMSMGGMIAQELAALTSPALVIIISSWKEPGEMPVSLKALRGTHPERVLTSKLIKRILPLLYWQMGAENDEDRALIDSFVQTMPLDQIKAQLDASLNWNGPSSPFKKLVHIHGDNDHLMPIADIKGAIPVKDGGHMMVFNKAAEISELIKAHLKKIK
jgi:pimeloyl-ACP methyl ester carboxylesterase